MKNTDEILKLYKQRITYYQPLHSKMRVIQSIYNGTIEIPLPDMDQSTMPFAPNLLAQGIDQMAGRITSVTPQVTFSSAKPGVRQYDRRALTAARAVTAWWQTDRLTLKMKQRGRHMIAYGMTPVILRWNRKKGLPTWHVRHPLETFPSTDIIPGEVTPKDCIFAYRRSVGWLYSNGYGDSVRQITGKQEIHPDASILLIEHVDENGTTLIAAGYQTPDPYAPLNGNEADGTVMKGVPLEFFPNMIDQTPAVVPMRVTLDTAQGQFDNMKSSHSPDISRTPLLTGWKEISGSLLVSQRNSAAKAEVISVRGVEATLFFPLLLTTPWPKPKNHSLSRWNKKTK
jgi:hypothetical protein